MITRPRRRVNTTYRPLSLRSRRCRYSVVASPSIPQMSAKHEGTRPFAGLLLLRYRGVVVVHPCRVLNRARPSKLAVSLL